MDAPDSPGGINDENLDILAAILKQIPECIDEANFDHLSKLLPNMEPVHRGGGPCRLRSDHADYADFSNPARPPKIKLRGIDPERWGME